jgi:hypothetical protein
VLDSVPTTIEAIYSQALRNISPQDMDIAQSILVLLLSTGGCVEVDVATDYAGLSSPSQLIQICTSTILQLDRSNGTLEFSHPSVETFLLSSKTKLPESLHGFAFERQKAHAALAFRCLGRVNRGTKGAFLDYASLHLLSHADKAWNLTDILVPQYFIESFGSPESSAFLIWRRAQSIGTKLSEIPVEVLYPTPLYTVSELGHFKLALAILEHDATQSDRRGHIGTPLQLAANHGATQLVSRLLETGADVDAEPGTCGTVIFAACNDDHTEILKLLLVSSPTTTLNMPCQLSIPNKDRGTPLYIAALHGNQEAVDLLLKAGADPNSGGTIFGDALQMAAASGYEKVVRTLLQNGDDPTLMHESFGTAYLAALHRSEDPDQTGVDEERDRIATLLGPMPEPQTVQGYVWKDAIAAAATLLAKRYRTPWMDTFERASSTGFHHDAGQCLTNSQAAVVKAYYYAVPSQQLRRSVHSVLSGVNGSGLRKAFQEAFDLGQPSVGAERPSSSEYNTMYAYHKHYFRASVYYLIESVRGVITF